ncbi:MAG: prolipoprotein diacylglyceryl transferase [Clostridia bacterium]|nr:prolipoprotein diacylglyceryl transferase [Clostridia bacterium]
MTTYHVTIFGINLTINPVAFSIAGWDIYWYGIIIACGFGLALLYAFRNAKRFEIDLDRLLDVVLVTAPIAVLCARAYYLLFDPSGVGIKSFSQFFGFDGSGFQGLAIYGGVVGAAVVGTVMCKIRKISIPATLDLAAIGFLIGQGIGRWGNFTNQEAFGAATGSNFWGMTSENVARELGEGVLAHPCFLYESIWCLTGFVVLHILSKKKQYKGQIALGYCLWYGVGRVIIEGLRTDSLYLWGTSIRVSQALSLLLVISSVTVLAVMEVRRKKKLENATYENIFGEVEETTITEISSSENAEEETPDA